MTRDSCWVDSLPAGRERRPGMTCSYTIPKNIEYAGVNVVDSILQVYNRYVDEWNKSDASCRTNKLWEVEINIREPQGVTIYPNIGDWLVYISTVKEFHMYNDRETRPLNKISGQDVEHIEMHYLGKGDSHFMCWLMSRQQAQVDKLLEEIWKAECAERYSNYLKIIGHADT